MAVSQTNSGDLTTSDSIDTTKGQRAVMGLQSTYSAGGIRSSRTGDEGEENWRSIPSMQRRGLRGKIALLLDNQRFNIVMGCVITANVCFMIQETDQNAACALEATNTACETDHIKTANIVFLGIYMVELGARFYVMRTRVVQSYWNILDITVVVFGMVDMIMDWANL
jgi:hypothetical protein